MDSKNKKFCSVTLTFIDPVFSRDIDWYDIKVSLHFRRFSEIHLHCKDVNSLNTDEDHNILWKELLHPSVYKTSLFITPSKLETVGDLVADGLKNDQDFIIRQELLGVTPGVLDYVLVKISKYVGDHIRVDDDNDDGVRGLCFKIMAVVDVSTVDFGHDIDVDDDDMMSLEGCD